MKGHKPVTMTDLYDDGPAARSLLRELFGAELPPKITRLEGEMARLLEEELPDADAASRRDWAHRLAVVIAFDPWFAKLGQGVTPGRVAGALNRVARAARDLKKALDAMPEVAATSLHRRLIDLDAPDDRSARMTFFGESVIGTLGAGAGGLPARRAALEELMLVVDDAHESWRTTKAGKHRADRIARHVADAYEALKGKPTPCSGSGEGAFYRLLEYLLSSVGLEDVSAAELGRREVERRDAAAHSGEISA